MRYVHEVFASTEPDDKDDLIDVFQTLRDSINPNLDISSFFDFFSFFKQQQQRQASHTEPVPQNIEIEFASIPRTPSPKRSRTRQPCDDTKKKKEVLERYGLVPLRDPDHISHLPYKEKATKTKTKNAQVRYFEGVPVTTKGEKYVAL